MNQNLRAQQHGGGLAVKPIVTRGPKRYRPLKRRLHRAGVTYDDVARFAGVTWRMVKYVVDGQRTSEPIMAAINRLAPLPVPSEPSA